MLLKSAFLNKIFINILFFVFLTLSLLGFIRVFISHSSDFNIPLFGKTNTPVIVNMETSSDNISKIRFFIENKEIKPYRIYENNSYAIYEENSTPVSIIRFNADNNKVLDAINNITIVLGKNLYYYSTGDIKNFQKKDKSYILPLDMRYIKSGKYINDKGNLHRFFTYFLSIFYNTNFYIIPLLLLSLAILIYLANKQKFDFNFTFFKNHALLLIIFLGIILRLADNNQPFWGDELYTAVIASGIDKPFAEVFHDPGNPPLFFILAKIWMLLFSNNEIACRLLATLFSVLTIPLLYLFVKENSNKQPALLASFLFTINVYSIHSAQEFRCYSLSIFLAVLMAHYFFKLIKYKNNKDFIIYGLIAALMANTHYFLIIILFNTFIFAMFIFDNKSRLKFFLANLFGAVMFLPYFLAVALNQALLNKGFNNMPLFNLEGVYSILKSYFSNNLIPVCAIILFILLIIPKIKNKLLNNNNALNLFIFSVYTVFGLFITAQLFSIFVRPILKTIYPICIISFLPVIISCVLGFYYKNRFIKLFIVLIFLFYGVFCLSGRGLYVWKDDMLVLRVEEILKYSNADLKQYSNNKNIITMIIDYDEYGQYYKNFADKNQKIISYKFVDAIKDFFPFAKNANGDVMYAMFHYFTAPLSITQLENLYKVSLLKTDKGVILARMVKIK